MSDSQKPFIRIFLCFFVTRSHEVDIFLHSCSNGHCQYSMLCVCTTLVRHYTCYRAIVLVIIKMLKGPLTGHLVYKNLISEVVQGSC